MKGLFSIDSKLFQFLTQVSEVVYLNLLYLLCCLPVVTIGAAQSGMMNAARVMRDPNDDSSCYQAFFRGFKSGFGKITVVWLICCVGIVSLTYSAVMVYYYDGILESAPVIMSVIALLLFIVFQCMTVTFHSRFDCSVWQIIRNSLFMILMHPIRAVGITLALWGPVLVFLLDLKLFITITLIFLFAYYTVAFQFAAGLMKKPFDMIEAQFFPAQDADIDIEEQEEICEETDT